MPARIQQYSVYQPYEPQDKFRLWCWLKDWPLRSSRGYMEAIILTMLPVTMLGCDFQSKDFHDCIFEAGVLTCLFCFVHVC